MTTGCASRAKASITTTTRSRRNGREAIFPRRRKYPAPRDHRRHPRLALRSPRRRYRPPGRGGPAGRVAEPGAGPGAHRGGAGRVHGRDRAGDNEAHDQGRHQIARITQAQVATMLGLSRPHLANALAGRYSLSSARVVKLRAFLARPRR